MQPKSVVILFNRGLCNLSLGENAAAEHDFSTCIGLRPDLTVARFNRAVARYRQKKNTAAVEDIDDLVKANSAGAKVLLMRARILRASGNAEQANRDIQRALSSKPRDVEDWKARGIAQMKLNPTLALADFEKALSIRSDDFDALNNAAYLCSEKLSRTAEAVKYLDAIVRQRPIASSYASRGIMQARLQNLPAAMADAISAMKTNPGAREKLQIAGVHSLVGASLDNSSESHPEFSIIDLETRAIEWLQKTLRDDPSLAIIAKTDPDLRWVMQRDAARRILKSAEVLIQPATDP